LNLAIFFCDEGKREKEGKGEGKEGGKGDRHN
jgi:hypothetical protein